RSLEQQHPDDEHDEQTVDDRGLVEAGEDRALEDGDADAGAHGDGKALHPCTGTANTAAVAESAAASPHTYIDSVEVLTPSSDARSSFSAAPRMATPT